MSSIQHQSAIVTGAGKGIGRSIAIALAKEGVHVGLIARTEAEIASLSAHLTQVYGVNAYYVAADVAVRQDIEGAVATLIDQLGTLDILINNAGTAKFGKVAEMDPADWENIIQVNLLGTYYATRAALPTLLDKQQGAIINIASTAGERGFATGSAYCASKFAVLGFTESLMQEVRKSNIRVTALLPSTVNTPLAAENGLPIGDEDRMMQPEDVAALTIHTLKLPPRVFVKAAGIWTTNP